MKKYINNSLLLLSIIAISCNDLLDAEAENTISGDIIVDANSAQNVLDGAYFNLFGIYDGSNGGELLGGDFKIIPTLLSRHDGQEVSWQSDVFPNYTRFSQNNFTNVDPRIEANWLRGYETINIANNLLANLDVIQNSGTRELIEGQSLAIRGVLYFEMVRLWAPQYSSANSSAEAIPLIDYPINTTEDLRDVQLATVDAIYTQVENDLERASLLLEDKNLPKNRLSYYAVEAYRGKVAMQKSEYADAITHFNNVIDGPFELMDSPLDAFNNSSPVSEDILVVVQTPVATTGNLTSATGLAPMFSRLNSTGYGAFQILESTFGSLQKTFIPNNANFYQSDIRHSIQDAEATDLPESIDSAFYKTNVNLSSSKFLRSTDVIPVIRLAEIHLARAEAIHEDLFVTPIDPTALEDLNKIRRRARIPELDGSQSEFAFVDSVRVEKNRELLYEGLVFHDLKRWRLNDSDVSIAFGVNPLDVILPIPQSECLASPGLCD
ncbi:RagB/SusD family nutrient uptake outer membrane protein [Ekhidna sp.]|uniref:RagB/SusD family nutrient uptake outer membrane protein n=1 Tax=Ekhidna sp. TaxID=2608089 RepID=UPI003B59E3AE